MSKSTPGPWRVNLTRVKQGYSDSYNVSGPEYEVCRMMGMDNEDKANALLIAATPELLEAARYLLDRLDYHLLTTGADHMLTTSRTALRSAIAKAEGV